MTHFESFLCPEVSEPEGVSGRGKDIETKEAKDNPCHDRKKMGKMGIVMAFYDINKESAT